MAWFVGQSLLMLVLAFLLGLLVGWFIWGRSGRQRLSTPVAAAVQRVPAAAAPETATPPAAQPEPEPEPEPVAPEPEPVALEPALFTVPVKSTSDDLKRIEGIGPKMAGALNAAGISTFAELARTDVPVLEDAIRAGGLRFAPSLTTWSAQAQLLADGDEAGFRALTRSLVAGRRPKETT